jgi:hypothetical protein
VEAQLGVVPVHGALEVSDRDTQLANMREK